MTAKRFYMDKSGDLYDRENKSVMVDFGYSYDGVGCKRIIDLLNELHEENEQLKSRCNDYDKALKTLQDLTDRKLKENEQLKKALLFFYDVANCECSTNWKVDMEKGCKRFFNCTYEEAEEKYGDYDGMWWELE